MCAPGVAQESGYGQPNFVLVDLFRFSYKFGRSPNTVNRATCDVDEVLSAIHIHSQMDSEVDIVPDLVTDPSDSPCVAEPLPNQINVDRSLDFRDFSDGTGYVVGAAGVGRVEPSSESLDSSSYIFCCPRRYLVVLNFRNADVSA